MLCKDEWLSQYFDGGAYSYRPHNDNEFEKIHKGLIYAKLSSEDTVERNYLIRNGFRMIETSIFFEQQSSITHYSKIDINIGFVQSEDAQAVIQLAKESFVFSRFHQDEHISRTLANQIKADWVGNFFYGKRGDAMIIARIDEKIAGFLLLINRNTIDLIAVSPCFQRKGIASAMIGFANTEIGLLKAGTQLINAGSIAIYHKNGFIVTKFGYVLHKLGSVKENETF